MAFNTLLSATELGGGAWELTAALSYSGNAQTFVVPAGYRTDFTSVPRVFTWLVANTGEYTKAAVLHDWLLTEAVVSRRDADGIFRRALHELGQPWLRRHVMWAAVRIAGRLSGASAAQLGLIAVLALLVLPIAIPGALLVLLGLIALWLLEVAIWPLLRLLDQRANRPTSFWWT